jgi:Ner family transcriptional regulator
MDKINGLKKANLPDWHPADIVASLRKAGWSLRRLSLSLGFSEGYLKTALAHPYPKAEAMIAEALGLHPMQIWPSRYTPDGRPNRPIGRRPHRHCIAKSEGRCNGKV